MRSIHNPQSNADPTAFWPYDAPVLSDALTHTYLTPERTHRSRYHMPASPGMSQLLTYTKAVMPSLPVVLKRTLATG